VARRPHLGLLLVATVVLGASAGVVFPLLPELQKAYGLPTWSLGVMSAATFFTNVVSQLVLGSQADRGRARLMVFLSLGVAGLGLLWFAIGTELWQFVGARALSGVAIGGFSPAARAIVAATEPDRLGHRLGQLAGAELSGFIAGPMLGVALVDPFSLKTPFWAIAVIVAVTLIALATQPFPTGIRADAAFRRTTALDLLKSRQVVVAVLLAIGLFLPVGVYDSLWSRYLQDRGASVLYTGLSLSAYGVPFVAFAALGGRLADRFGPVRSSVAAMVFIVPIVALYGVLPTPGLVVGVAMLEAVAQAVAVPASQAAMVRACPPDRVGTGQGLAGAAGQLAAGFTALVAAPVYSRFGSEAVFGGAALVIGVIAIVAVALNGGRRAALSGAAR
jgi:MFS family permease